MQLRCCLVVAAVLGAAVAQWPGGGPLHRSVDECPPCDVSTCEKSLDCPAGQFFAGPCACCAQCALPYGARCYNQSIPGLPKPPTDLSIVPCGENLECLLRKDLAPRVNTNNLFSFYRNYKFIIFLVFKIILMKLYKNISIRSQADYL